MITAPPGRPLRPLPCLPASRAANAERWTNLFVGLTRLSVYCPSRHGSPFANRYPSRGPALPMAAKITVALDAMGGDSGPGMVVPGAELAAIRHPQYRFLLFGDHARIGPIL